MIPVAILGATGVVGQRYASLLQNHPWFEVVYMAASEHWVGSTYGEAVEGRWVGCEQVPLREMRLGSTHAVPSHCQLVFSAMPNGAPLEWELAARGMGVISHSSAQRHRADVPVIIPEINPHHLDILPDEGGWVIAKPNCSLQSYLLPLYPLHKEFGVREIHVTTLQAVSGAGLAGFGLRDNVIPYIAGEEEKSEQEPLKILGRVCAGLIVPTSEIIISAHCNRVPVIDGHLACISVGFERKPSREAILEIWEAFRGEPQRMELPSAPKRPIHYFEEVDRPQPQRDCELEAGMAVSIGRLRPCPLLDFRMVGLSHNAVRGAAGGAILTAELAVYHKARQPAGIAL